MVRVWCIDSHLSHYEPLGHGFVLVCLCAQSIRELSQDEPQRERWLFPLAVFVVCFCRSRIAISDIDMSKVCAVMQIRVVSLIAHAGDGPFSFSGTWLERGKKIVSQHVFATFSFCISFSHTFFIFTSSLLTPSILCTHTYTLSLVNNPHSPSLSSHSPNSTRPHTHSHSHTRKHYG